MRASNLKLLLDRYRHAVQRAQRFTAETSPACIFCVSAEALSSVSDFTFCIIYSGISLSLGGLAVTGMRDDGDRAKVRLRYTYAGLPDVQRASGGVDAALGEIPETDQSSRILIPEREPEELPHV